jgi:hypothetical protein
MRGRSRARGQAHYHPKPEARRPGSAGGGGAAATWPMAGRPDGVGPARGRARGPLACLARLWCQYRYRRCVREGCRRAALSTMCCCSGDSKACERRLCASAPVRCVWRAPHAPSLLPPRAAGDGVDPPPPPPGSSGRPPPLTRVDSEALAWWVGGAALSVWYDPIVSGVLRFLANQRGPLASFLLFFLLL